MAPPPPEREPLILVNTPGPAVPGYRVIDFGHCRSDRSTPYRPEAERRSLEEILSRAPGGETPAALLIRSPEYLPIPDGLEAFSGRKLLAITDWNVCLRFLPELCRLFDRCFVDWPGCEVLRAAGVLNAAHQPLFGHDPARFFDRGMPRDLDLSFCGNRAPTLHGERNRLLERLEAWGRSRRVFLGRAFGQDYVTVLNRSRLVFNFSVRGEANMRLYEAMACGAVPLVEAGNLEAPMLFQEGVHYFSYTPERLEETLDALLADPARIARAARAGSEAVANQTLPLQLARLLDEGLAGTRTAAAAPDPETLASARLSQVLMRLLGAGYTPEESLREARALSASLPSLGGAALIGILLELQSTDGGEALGPTLSRLLDALLNAASLPSLWKSYFSFLQALGTAHAETREARENERKRARELLGACATWSASGWNPGYRVLIPPLSLAGSFNLEFNRCYRDFLDTGRHDALLLWMEEEARRALSGSAREAVPGA